MGHPRLYSTWTDESLNKYVARIASVVHPTNFEEPVLERIDLQTHYVVAFGAL